MADINDVLELLVTDPEFRARVATDPVAALAGYELSADDVGLLAASLDEGSGDLPRGVEQRTSKSALLGLLASLAPTTGLGTGAVKPADVPVPVLGEDAAQETEPVIESISFNFEEIKVDRGDDAVGPDFAGAEGTSTSEPTVAFNPEEYTLDEQTPWKVPESPNPGDTIAAPEDEEAIGLLLPAVQKVREAANKFETGPATAGDALADAPASPSTVSGVDAVTIKQTSVDDPGAAAPSEPVAGTPRRLVQPADDPLSIDDA